MSYVGYQTRVAAHASVNERVEFLKKTYLHLGGAILAWVGLMTIMYNSSFGMNLARSLAGNWLMVIIAFMVGRTLCDKSGPIKWVIRVSNISAWDIRRLTGSDIHAAAHVCQSHRDCERLMPQT